MRCMYDHSVGNDVGPGGRTKKLLWRVNDIHVCQRFATGLLGTHPMRIRKALAEGIDQRSHNGRIYLITKLR